MCWLSGFIEIQKKNISCIFGGNILFLYKGRKFDQIAHKKIGLHYFLYDFFHFQIGLRL